MINFDDKMTNGLIDKLLPRKAKNVVHENHLLITRFPLSYKEEKDDIQVQNSETIEVQPLAILKKSP